MTAIRPRLHTECCPDRQCFHIFIPKTFKENPFRGSRVCVPTDGVTCSAKDFQRCTGYTSLLKNRLPPEDRKIGTRQMVPILTESRMGGTSRKLEKHIYLTSIRDVLYNCSNRWLAENSDAGEWEGGSDALKEWYLAHETYLQVCSIDLGSLSRKMCYLSLKPTNRRRTERVGGAFDPKYNYGQDVEIKASSIPNAGQGVFTLVPRHKGDVVGQYVGRIITREELLTMSKDDINKIIAFVDATNREQLIDGKGSKHFSAFINHKWRTKSNPREAANLATDSAGHFVCLRDLEAGEELFMDYGLKYWAYQLFGIDIDEIEDTERQIEVMKQVYEKLPNTLTTVQPVSTTNLA